MLISLYYHFNLNRQNGYNNIVNNQSIPKSGLNFLVDDNLIFNPKFLLLCGFEKFRNFYVRVDILEKLFLKIIENTEKNDFKINAEMMNLIGSSKENFYKLVNLMNYRKKNKDKDIFYYTGDNQKRKKTQFLSKIRKKDNPFQKLTELNIK